MTLTATATQGSTFVGWSGDCSGIDNCELGGLDDADVTATFESCVSTGSQTFEHTGGPQTLSLPPCATSMTIDARGAAGGRATYNSTPIGLAGLGGRTQATIAIAPGDTFTVFVGGSGIGTVGGFNGGATGATSNTQTGGGGGGASDIRRNGVALGDRVVIAGGGGGAAACAGSGWNGAAGGGFTGGSAASTCTSFATLASGGTQSMGGRGGVYISDSSSPSCGASSGTLGAGAGGCTQSAGGGGGGGYYGGGGGSWHGGGGGSSFAISSATNVSHTQGAHAGAGQVIVTWE